MVNPTLHQLSKFALSCIVFFSFIFGTLPLKVLAFDDAAEINHTYLNQENFLDIKSYQFNKLREEEWYESSGGWRLTGGSLGLDLLYSQLEVRLPHSISEETTVIFLAKQQEFYEIKPFRYQVEVEWRPYNLAAFSLLACLNMTNAKQIRALVSLWANVRGITCVSKNCFRICITTKKIFTTIPTIHLIQLKIIWKARFA